MSKKRTQCTVPGCEAVHFGRGMCKAHYNRWRRRGTTDKLVRIRNPYSGVAYRKSHRAEAAARARAWRIANPEKRLETEKRYRAANKHKTRLLKKAWRKANPEKHQAAARRSRVTKWMPLSKFSELLVQQRGRCAICGAADPGRKQSGHFAIDHCHTTNAVRGLLCHPCNAMLGFAKDSVETLRKAILYLEHHSNCGALHREEQGV